MYRAAFEERAHFQLAAVAAWVLGEYGDAAVARDPPRMAGEAGLVLSQRRGAVHGECTCHPRQCSPMLHKLLTTAIA